MTTAAGKGDSPDHDLPFAQRTSAPLHGVRVLEICPGSAGVIGRYLVELGADVIHIPQQDLRDDALASLVANTGKRVLPLDLEKDRDRARFVALAEGADIIIETRLDSQAPDILSSLPQIRSRNPKAVVLSISPFGRGNDYAHWQMTSSVLDALGGILCRSGFPEREPLLPPVEITLQCAYQQAGWIALLAYLNRLRTGEGDQIDLGLLEAAAQSMDPGYGIAGSAAAGAPSSALPRGRPEARHQYPLIRCKDGFVRICVLAPRQWQGMFEWLGRPEKYAGPEFNKLHVRLKTPTLISDIAALFADKTRAELQVQADQLGVPLAPVLSLEEALATEHVPARGALRSLVDETGRQVTVPNGVFEIDAERAGAGDRAERVGLDADWRESERFDPAPEAERPERPLSGFTLIDLGVIVAGAEQSRLLADQGALTLKVETSAYPDGGRQSLDGGIVSVNFALGHRNKKGLGLNLRDPRGKALMIELARQADVIMSNFRPGTLTSLGLDYSVLSAANPGIVMTDSSAYGPTGPWSKRGGYGPLVRASSGITDLWAYPGARGEFSDASTVYPDHVSGRCCAMATLALLIRRIRTGTGGQVSLAQAEVITAHLGDRVAALSVGEVRAARPDAPWGVYSCAGDDEWCAITVRHDADWRALAAEIGRQDWLADSDFASPVGRLARQSELDAGLAAWTAGLPPDVVMQRLQDAGVPAGRMLRVFELPAFGYFQARDTFRPASHPLINGEFMAESALARSERLKSPEMGPAPAPGEHSAWVARTMLGLNEAEIETLMAEGVLETWSPPA
jgi:crotonobetainyl-CoA:carnitine CoA-transferase CaiB-like acyl-CoA transferase